MLTWHFDEFLSRIGEATEAHVKKIIERHFEAIQIVKDHIDYVDLLSDSELHKIELLVEDLGSTDTDLDILNFFGAFIRNHTPKHKTLVDMYPVTKSEFEILSKAVDILDKYGDRYANDVNAGDIADMIRAFFVIYASPYVMGDDIERQEFPELMLKAFECYGIKVTVDELVKMVLDVKKLSEI